MNKFGMLLAILLAIAAVGGGPQRCPGEETRDYQQGPLSPRDFQATPPTNHPHKAHTSTRLKYFYQYRTTTRNGSTVARMSKITLDNHVVQSESWNVRPADRNLLAHEQGHFDVTECVRRRAEAYWKKRLPELEFRADQEEAALKLLQDAVVAEMKPFFDWLSLLQKRYDEETRHGLAPAEQARWREQLDLLLRDPLASIPALSP